MIEVIYNYIMNEINMNLTTYQFLIDNNLITQNIEIDFLYENIEITIYKNLDYSINQQIVTQFLFFNLIKFLSN